MDILQGLEDKEGCLSYGQILHNHDKNEMSRGNKNK